MTKPRNTKKRMEKILGILNLVKSMKGNNMKYLSENLSDEAIELLSECVYNSITNIRNNEKRNILRRKLMNDKDNIRFLSRPQNDLKRKRQIIPQMGRGLGLIAQLLIPLLTTVIQSATSKPKSKPQPTPKPKSKAKKNG